MHLNAFLFIQDIKEHYSKVFQTKFLKYLAEQF